MTLKRYAPAVMLMTALVAVWPSLLTAAPHTIKTKPGQLLMLVEREPDPDGEPRPWRDERNVPLRTSLYFEVGAPANIENNPNYLLPGSVAVSLQAQGGPAIDLLKPGWQFVGPASGWLQPGRISKGMNKKVESLLVYIEPGLTLKPLTTYTVHVSALSARSAPAGDAEGSGGSANGKTHAFDADWSFTTEAAPAVHPVTFPLDFAVTPVTWHGLFWSGFCNIIFCTDAKTYGPTYDLMAQARKEHPKAWSYQRDFWLLGTDNERFLPNIVRERETRRIKAIESRGDTVLLSVEDFFGHEQYGIPSGRSLSVDYHPGDEVLIADPVHDALAKVISVNDQAGTVLVTHFSIPAGGWQIEYAKPLPKKENPDAPGLFAIGGCFLRKQNPHGTACYYWGRLDKEWDLAVRHYGRRVQPNFTSAPTDLAIDGREFTYPKDYDQWHQVAETIAGHIIDRYGAASLHFDWSIFNEPDLGVAFWRSKNWNQLQKFYDYTTDAILRAFEDRGYDSNQVFIGGLELGGIFGTNLKLTEFLAHCSPRATAKGALPLNAAFADKRLDGQRSKRVETLCRAHQGKGSPCDFISVHTYNRSEIVAGKLIKVKETALAIDPEYYRNLWANSHESCPDWAPPPDEAARDSYLGDGYYPSWCVDVVGRQLRQAAIDPRFSFGETILTTWGPIRGFAGLNSFTRILACDDHGQGKADRDVTIPYPVFNALDLLSDLGNRYWVLPEKQVGADLVSGFASRDDHGVIRVVLCAHSPLDTQSRSDSTFDVTLDLDHLGWEGPARVEEYRFDRDHNTYFREAKALRASSSESQTASSSAGAVDPARLEQTLRCFESPDLAVQRQGIKRLQAYGSAELHGPVVLEKCLAVLGNFIEQSKNKDVHDAAQRILWDILHGSADYPAVYTPAQVAMFQKLSQCHATRTTTCQSQSNGRLRLTAQLAVNGVNFLVIKPAPVP